MLSAGGLMSGKDRKRQGTKQSSGGYYQFTFEEDFSDGSDDFHDSISDLNLSPKDRVAKILEETELGPINVGESELPEPDFHLDLSDDDLDLSFNGRASPPSTLALKHHSGDTQDEGRPETPESLHSPLDHPDSGYIDFVHSRNQSSSERSPSEGFEDDFNIISSTHSVDDRPASSRKLVPAVKFTRFRADKLEENNYIDDEINTTRALTAELPAEVEMRDMTGDGEIQGRSQKDATYLPMPTDISLDPDEDTMLDERDRCPLEEDDRNPIIYVDQSSLATRYMKRKRKTVIAIGVVAVIFGIAGLSAIAYFLVKFLSNL